MIKISVQKSLIGSMGDMLLDINIEIKERSFLAIAGKSGSGKSTLLRIIAGLESAEGEIKVNDRYWLKDKKSLPPQQREIGFVFQNYALFENMKIIDNLLFVNKDKKLAYRLLELTELKESANRYPAMLSGGQKQRVALCRALMKRPKILLMDEPLSALDPLMRNRLQNDILKLHKEFKTTTIMVSHEPSEIYKLAQELIILEDGKIKESGKPSEILLRSRDTQKLSFKGELLDIVTRDTIYIGIVSIGQQIVEIVLDKRECKRLKRGDEVIVSATAFEASISKI